MANGERSEPGAHGRAGSVPTGAARPHQNRADAALAQRRRAEYRASLPFKAAAKRDRCELTSSVSEPIQSVSALRLLQWIKGERSTGKPKRSKSGTDVWMPGRSFLLA